MERRAAQVAKIRLVLLQSLDDDEIDAGLGCGNFLSREADWYFFIPCTGLPESGLNGGSLVNRMICITPASSVQLRMSDTRSQVH